MRSLQSFVDMRPGNTPVPLGDRATRTLHALIPVATQNRWRDNGSIRSMFDLLTTFGFGVLSVLMPHLAMRMLGLRSSMRTEYYGDLREVLEIYDGPSEEGPVVLFVHGGAWGSGFPWMYTMLCHGLFASIQPSKVIIIGYRTYPDARIPEQAESVERALLHIRSKGLCAHNAPVLLAGHSSGAHISILYVLQALNESKPVLVDGVIALSGVFDIGKHYLWEAARGAHEVSPMKAAALGEQSFPHVSPTCLLRDGKISNAKDCPPVLVIHGTHDDTVPYTTSWDLAQALREYNVDVTMVLLPNASHTTPVEDLALRQESPTGEAIKEFYKRLLRPNTAPHLERVSKISHPLHLLPIKSKL